jgi:hypothetical protein
MNQSTNLAEIEKSARALKDELRRYRNEISDDPAKVAVSFGPPTRANQQKFLALLQDGPQPRRIFIPQEKVPHEYWNGLPLELEKRLRKLTKEEDIIEEMNLYAAEEIGLRNQATMQMMNHPPVQPPPLAFGQKPQVNIRSEDLPLPWRGRPIPPDLQERLTSLNTITEPSVRQMRTRDEINNFFTDQDQRRFTLEAVRKRRGLLDQQPVMQLPLQIEIIPSTRENGAPPNAPDLLLTPQPERQIKPTTIDTGKP